MRTKLVTIDKDNIDIELLREAGRIIKEGGLVAFPTETVYGLGGDALNPESSRRIYAAKGRPSDNPLIVHIADLKDLEYIVTDISDNAYKIADCFWPGPLTMIFKKSERVPKETTGGLDTVAVRLPSDEIARAFIREAGGYVAAPSANRSGRPSPTLAKYVIEDMDGIIDMIIDGGDSKIGLESTILDMTVCPPMILRPGFVTSRDIEKVISIVSIDETIISDSEKKAPKAPGMKYRHYAPRGELSIVYGKSQDVIEYINCKCREAKAMGKKTGVIATSESKDKYRADSIKDAGDRSDESVIARNLFRLLREFDDENIDIMFTEAFDKSGLSMATMNRLLKAAGHKEVYL